MKMDGGGHDRAASPGAENAVLDQHACPELQALLWAAHAVEAEAEDQEWTRIDPVEAPGLRRAATLIRLLAATHTESAHGPGRSCPAQVPPESRSVAGF